MDKRSSSLYPDNWNHQFILCGSKFCCKALFKKQYIHIGKENTSPIFLPFYKNNGKSLNNDKMQGQRSCVNQKVPVSRE